MGCRNLPNSWLQTCTGTSSLEMADDDWPAGAWLVPMPHFDSVGSKRSHLNQLLATCYWSAVLPCAAPRSIWYGKLMWHFDICAKLSFIYCQSQQRAMRGFGEGSLSPQPRFLLSARLCFLSVSFPPPLPPCPCPSPLLASLHRARLSLVLSSHSCVLSLNVFSCILWRCRQGFGFDVISLGVLND